MIRWSKAARTDFREAFVFIGADDAATADDVAKRIFAAAADLSALPGRGRPGRMPGTRELVVPGLPYCLIYRVEGEIIRVVRLLHNRRSWPGRRP